MVLTNCRACSGKRDLDDLNCRCGNGYVNEEGTFIPGSLVRAGQALSKKDYEGHKSCTVCNEDPEKCQWRKRRLSPSTKRQLDSDDKEGYFEFFTPSTGITPKILEDYLHVNGGKYSASVSGKRFKGREGFWVESRFRFNSHTIRELQDLTTLHAQGRLTSMTGKAPKTQGPFTEFTHYLGNTTNTYPSEAFRSPGRHERDSRTSFHIDTNPPFQDAEDSSRVNNRVGGKREQVEDEPGEFPAELTGAIRRISLSERSRDENLRQDISRSRHYGGEHMTKELSPQKHIQHDEAEQKSSRHDGSRREHVQRENPRQEHRTSEYSRHESSRHGQRPSSSEKGQPERRPSQYSQAQVPYSQTQVPYSQTQVPQSQVQVPYSHAQISTKDTSHEVKAGADVSVSSRGQDFFVPSEGIDLTVLAFYLKHFVDDSTTTTIKQAPHPKIQDRSGFLIHAKRAIDREELRHIMKDTEDWEKEQATRELRDNRCSYPNSDTAKRRQKRKRRSFS